MNSFEHVYRDLDVEGLEVLAVFEFGAAVTPPKKEVIIAQRMVKGERSNQRKETVVTRMKRNVFFQTAFEV